MFISDFAIKRPIATTVTMIVLVVFGIFALLKTDIDEYPDVVSPVIFIAAPYPGATPSQVEREVVDRLEGQLSGISGIDHIESTSVDGFAELTVFFQFGKNVDQASQDVRDAIAGVRDQLPTEMREPIIKKYDPSALPIVSLAMTSQALTPADLTLLADPGITKILRAIPGVAQVTVEGGDDRTVAVNIRPHDLQAANVSIGEVINALNTQNLAAPVGSVTGALTERTNRLNGRLQSPQDFLQLVVAQRGPRLIRLGQVADVRDTVVEPRSLALYNGHPGIGIDISKAKGVSTTRVGDAVTAKLAEIRRTLPAGVELTVVDDAGVRVLQSVRNVEEMLVEGAILTVLVVFIFLNSWRSTVITGLALPVSTLAAFIAVWAFGFTLNTMSLLGLSLAIGILIDDAIVVRENIVRHIEAGEDHLVASCKATDEIGLAVTATTLSIVAVFVPVAFMRGEAGQWFKPFALTVVCAVLVSLFVSFSLDPMLSAYWPDPQLQSHERTSAITRVLDRFNQWFDRQADRYKRIIAWALDHRWTMVGVAVASFVGALWLEYAFGGADLIPKSDRSELNITVQTPPGSNLDYIRLKLAEIERVLRSHPEVRYTYATVGSAVGSGEVDSGGIYVRLVPRSQRGLSQEKLGQIIRPELSHLGGVTAYVFEPSPAGNRKQIQVKLRDEGAGYATLSRFAAQVMDAFRHVPGATDIGLSTKGDRPELEIDLDRPLAATMGLSVSEVAGTLRPAFAGIHAGDWVDPTGKTRDVTVRLAPEARTNVSDLEQLPLVLAQPTGLSTIPLGAVASIRTALGPAAIEHYSGDEVISVEANVEGRSLSEVSHAINDRVGALATPPGIRITQGGEVSDQTEVYGDIVAALGLAVLLMYLILVVQFGSFLDPLTIMMALPLSLIGVVLALEITGETLNILSMIGVILLMGIVTKNSILLVDFAIWAKERDKTSTRDALIEAGRIRLRPILMTTMALIAGMLPVAIGAGVGGDFRRPLGIAVIGGVITSTILTLLVIPTFYEILDGMRTTILGHLAGARRRARAHVPEAAPGD